MTHGFRLLVAAVLALGALAGQGSAQTPAPRTLDAFESVEPWSALSSDGVKAAKRSVPGHEGRALRMDFDFSGVSGYAYLRRELPINFPENYEVSFWMRADAPVNTFEVKFTDSSGDNVWWRQRQNMTFPRDWTLVRIKKRDIELAWGPTTDRTLRQTAGVEFVVVRGQGGGKSWIEIDQLAIRELPPEPVIPPAPTATSSSAANGFPASFAVDANPATAWKAGSGPQSLTLDMGYLRPFGGLDLRWAEAAGASRYSVSTSEDGRAWTRVRTVENGDGGRDPLRLPDSEARFVRLDLQAGPAGGYALNEIEVEPLSFGTTATSFVSALAKDTPRGRYPRGFYEQPYWTLVGVDGGGESGLISEDGAVEVARGGYTIEPFVRHGGWLHSWADVQISHSLQDGYLPIPTVTWRHPEWELQVTTFAPGNRARSQLVTRYALKNLTQRPLPLQLVLTARPFQVNAPAQFLTTPGGVSPITAIGWDGARLSVNGEAKIRPLRAPTRFSAAGFDSGGTETDILVTALSPAGEVRNDGTGLASGAMIYDLTLAPGATEVLGWTAPLSGPAPAAPPPAQATAWLDAQQTATAAGWRGKLNRVGVTLPEPGRRLGDTLKTSLAHILMSRNGPILQPGTRSYNRSWIRDGAMIAESLVRLGDAETAADYLRWYAPYQFADGKVPCCVDARGADPVPENDSHGELIFLAAEVYRYTGDKAALRAAWPNVLKAARYMDTLRASEQTAANQAPERRHLYGLLPPTISHEGYSSKPAYSHWDNFWGLLGYKDAVVIAETLGEREAAAGLARSRDEFRRDILASIAAMPAKHRIDFIPGAADLGDFDATSTTIALAPVGEQANLPQAQLTATFEKYWRDFVSRREGRLPREQDGYTPYELRTVGAFVRLGWRARAQELLDFFFEDRRPQAWNGWAEGVRHDPRKIHFVGDMPHAWISSDYIRSALDMLAYDREADGALVLAAGIPADWLRAASGIGVRDLRTPYGSLTYSLKPEDGALRLTVSGSARPPGGYVLPWWGLGAPPAAVQNGRPLAWRNGELHIAPGGGAVLIRQP